MRASPTASAESPRTTVRRRRPARRSPSPRKQRDPFFDNAKYLAIVLVAIGRSLGAAALRQPQRHPRLYTLVYAVHMPAFIVISGYFSRSFRATPPQIRRLLTRIVVPYVVFETAYTLFTRWTDHQPDRAISLLDPPVSDVVPGGPVRLAPHPHRSGTTSATRCPSPWRSRCWRRSPPPSATASTCSACCSSSRTSCSVSPPKPEHFQLVRRPEVRQLAVPVFDVRARTGLLVGPALRRLLALLQRGRGATRRTRLGRGP
ncbi:acyltransferase family protein [Streptomyces sp. L7]